MRFRNVISLSLCATFISISALAQGLPKAKTPEEVGLSSERLKRLTAVLQADVDKGVIPGAVVLIARNGKIGYLQAVGFQDREKQVPMKPDAIFRVASMTKPFTSIAAMMLVEEGKLLLSDRVSSYLPQFKELKVGVEKIGEAGKPELTLEPARTEPTIQDLLRHTAGFTYGFMGKPTMVKQAYLQAKLFDPQLTIDELTSKLAALPLAYQPGTTWDYGMSVDVLGRVVEVVTGGSLDQFIADRITKPLKLNDTGFYIDAAKASRVAEPQVEPSSGKRPMVVPTDPTKRPNWMSGGGGMVSTASDYARFAGMLLNGGELDGAHILSSRTIAFMTADNLPVDVASSPVGTMMGIGPRGESGFGLGFAVRTQQGRATGPGAPGQFYWSGIWGTSFWVDAKDKLIVVAMLQIQPALEPRYRPLIRNLAYQALLN
jgi:CubicO group peptidase (beta-lactamase class C family)